MKKSEPTEDWLDTVHSESKSARECLFILSNIASQIRYVHPKIAEDIRTEVNIIKENIETIGDAVGQSLTERLADHNKFVGTMITSMLHIKEPSKGIVPLSFEDWLAEPTNGWDTRQDEIDCELSESGANTDLDFDLDREQEERYQLYILELEN